MSHLSLDARAILEYLNELGYRNISAEQLKEFMKDLRKLIKYEESIGINANQDDYFESLFRRTTASYRAKVDKENVQRHMTNGKQKNKEGTEVRHAMRSQSQDRNKAQKQPALGNAAQKNKSAPISTNVINENMDDGQRFLAFRERNSIINTLAPDPAAANDGSVPAFTHLRAISLHPNPQPTGQFGQRSVFESQVNLRSLRSASSPSIAPSTRQTASVYGAKRAVSSDIAKSSSNRQARQHQIESDQVRTSANRNMGSDVPSRSQTAIQRVSAAETGPKTARSAGSVMIPDRCAVNRRHRPLSHDPVALYHYYRSEWRHFQDQIPGENSHAELRWRVRHKLLNPH